MAGGTGSFLIAIMRRHPDLRGTLFELPDTCAVAEAIGMPARQTGGKPVANEADKAAWTIKSVPAEDQGPSVQLLDAAKAT